MNLHGSIIEWSKYVNLSVNCREFLESNTFVEFIQSISIGLLVNNMIGYWVTVSNDAVLALLEAISSELMVGPQNWCQYRKNDKLIAILFDCRGVYSPHFYYCMFDVISTTRFFYLPRRSNIMYRNVMNSRRKTNHFFNIKYFHVDYFTCKRNNCIYNILFGSSMLGCKIAPN